MTTEMTERPIPSIDYDALAKLLLKNDTSVLSPQEKIAYYKAVCDHVGLDWLTQPFDFLPYNGKEQLYANKTCAAQLRYIHKLDTKIVEEKLVGDYYVVRARVQFPDGRGDEDNGAVSLGGLRGQGAADAMMKCATKAKRRATLSAVGLGMMDQSEVETLPDINLKDLKAATDSAMANAARTVVDTQTGKVLKGDSYDTETGEIKPSARGGYYDSVPGEPPFPVRGYTYSKNGWSEAWLVNHDPDGGSLKVSTSLEFGKKLKIAEDQQIRVFVKVHNKSPHRPGEALLDFIEFETPF